VVMKGVKCSGRVRWVPAAQSPVELTSDQSSPMTSRARVPYPTSSRPFVQSRPSAAFEPAPELEPEHALSAERSSPAAVSVGLSSRLPS